MKQLINEGHLILPSAVMSDSVTVTVMSLVDVPPFNNKITGTTPDVSDPEKAD